MEWWSVVDSVATRYSNTPFPHFRSPVPIGGRHRECIRQMAHFAHRPFAQKHLDDVEAYLHFRMAQQLQVVQGSLREKPAFTRINSGSGASPIFRRAGLHLDKDKAVMIAEDEIDFTPIRPKIGRKEFQSRLA